MRKKKAPLRDDPAKALRSVRKRETRAKARPARTRPAEKTSLAEAILQNIAEGTNMVRAKDGILLHVTPQFAKMFGYEPDELVGEPVSILNAPGDESPEEVAARITARLKKHGTWSGDIYNRKKDGTEFWCHVSISSLKHPLHGDVWISIHEDITERKLAEAALLESEERLRLVNLATNDVIWDWDIVKDLQIWNKEGSAVFGWSDIVDHPQSAAWWVERVHPEDRHRVETGFFKVISDPKADFWKDEYRFLKADGSYAKVIDRGHVLRNAGGQAVRMIGAMLDITERNRVEEELIQSHEQLQALSAKMDSIREEEKANIAREIHDDLGQRLTGLLMDLSLLSKKLPENLKPLKDKAEAIAEEVGALIKTVRRISTDLRRGILDDLGLVPAIEWLCDDFLGRHGIPCSMDFETKSVEIGRERVIGVFRIVQEALTNVARHSGAGNVALELKVKPAAYVLTIEDDGRGFDPAEIPNPTSLGLLGMKERARYLGGDITVISAPKKGTKIVLTIPKKSGPRGRS